ncbi:hypothetical protein BDFB_007413, partial [Asbolus verrucosus]
MASQADINIDTNNFEPKKPSNKRRKNSVGDNGMEVEVHNGIEGKVRNRPNPKRIRTKSYSESKDNMRKIPVPAHRYTPLKENWLKIFTPIVEHLNLQVRFNLKTRNVEIKTCEATGDL